MTQTIRRFLRESPVVLGARLVLELADEWMQLVAWLGASRCSDVKEKLEARLTVEYHAIEKGLSLGQPRLGFGEKRILALLEDLRAYLRAFGDREFVAMPMATIRGYLAYHDGRGHDPARVRAAFERFERESAVRVPDGVEGGVRSLRRSELAGADVDFASFAAARHSLRAFSEEPVTREQIESALRVARTSPSACNRQSWHAYVYTGAEKDRILSFQGGANGFGDSAGAAIVVAGDLRNFFINEIHQPYVDASLFAMTLMFAFHGQGMGSIPLTTSFKRRRLREFRSRFGIAAHHVPAMIVAVGHLREEFNVAVSHRKDVGEFTTFVGGA